ncbi:hypothetical protein QR680_018956 [Steinernema hermaphroditum]|uniref:Uncharacterized protein n=1 Tax=Steinernema hermaphroditum TaxID=289476 RepID=A0AA39LR51_9BILA|nr:hypothetical protein QR680_018956 [Steinernema hermaphroditum]
MSLDVERIKEETLNAQNLDAIRSLYTVILDELEQVTADTKRNMRIVSELKDVLEERRDEIEHLKSVRAGSVQSRTYGVRENRVIESRLSRCAEEIERKLMDFGLTKTKEGNKLKQVLADFLLGSHREVDALSSHVTVE